MWVQNMLIKYTKLFIENFLYFDSQVKKTTSHLYLKDLLWKKWSRSKCSIFVFHRLLVYSFFNFWYLVILPNLCCMCKKTSFPFFIIFNFEIGSSCLLSLIWSRHCSQRMFILDISFFRVVERKFERKGPSGLELGSCILSWKTTFSPSKCHQILHPGRRKSAILDKWAWRTDDFSCSIFWEMMVLARCGSNLACQLIIESCLVKELVWLSLDCWAL